VTVIDHPLPTSPASPPALIPREVLFGDPERLSPQLSPDGNHLAWLAPDQGVLNLWTRNLHDPAGTQRAVTAERDRGIHQFCWSPDSTRLLYLRDDNGDENDYLREIDLTTGAERDLTPTKGVKAIIVKTSSRRPREILVGLNDTNPQLHDAYLLDLTTGALTKTWTNPGMVGFVADDDLQVRAAIAPQPDGGMTLLVRDHTDDDAWRPLLDIDFDDAMSTQPLAFSADGTLLVCVTSCDAETAELVQFDLATSTKHVLTSDPVFDVAQVSLHPATHEPRIAFIQRERLHARVLDPGIEGDIAVLEELDGGDFTIVSTDQADTTWVIATVHDAGPIRYHLYDRASRTSTPLFTHQPQLERYQLAAMQPFSIAARDGLALSGYLTFPAGRPRRNLPAVLLVHGGPWHRDTWGYHPEAQWLANRGYLCIQVNFRGSTGYGKQFLAKGNREWGNRMHDDLVDTLAYAISQGWVDPARVGIYGASFGGYAALIGAAFTPDTFAAAVTLCGPVNIKTLIDAIPPYWVPLRAQFATRIGDPDTEADLLWSRSPLSRVEDIRSPILIGQGANDPRVPTTEAEQLVAALQANNIAHDYLLYPDEGHGLVKAPNRLDFYAATERFLSQHLGGAHEPTAHLPTVGGPVERARAVGQWSQCRMARCAVAGAAGPVRSRRHPRAGTNDLRWKDLRACQTQRPQKTVELATRSRSARPKESTWLSTGSRHTPPTPRERTSRPTRPMWSSTSPGS
jgi:dipeptidyl aminopeptidase/acylaminoacyl peptidase